MATSTDFKTVDIPVNTVNSYIPPIVINEADNDGRHLRFIPMQDGQTVTGFTSARLYYDPRPRDASSIGDYVEGTQDGDGWVFILPDDTFTAGVEANASVSFIDSDGETFTRSIQFYVESGGTKATSQGTRIDKLVQQLTQMLTDFTMTAEAETGEAGSQANVTVTRMNGGAYNLQFVIPRGDKGDTGDAATIKIRNVTTGDPGTDASIENFGTDTNAVFDVTIPRGDKGQPGTAATIEIENVTTGQPGTNAIVENIGSDTNARLNITIPRGDKGDTGDAATIQLGTVTTGDPGTNAEVTNSGTENNAVFNFTLPRGDVGPAGVNENVPLGTVSGVVAQASDAYPALPRKVQVHGKTINNLWPNFNASTSISGITVSQDASGLITVSGTSTSDSEQFIYRDLNFDTGNKKFFFISSIETNANFKIQIATQQASSYSEASPTIQGINYTPVEDAKSFGCYIRWTVPIGETINTKLHIMLVEGDTNPGVFVPSGVNNVEPTKLVAGGKNLASVTTNSNNPNLLISDVLPPGDYVFSAVGDVLEQGYNLKANDMGGYEIVSNVKSQTAKFSLKEYTSVYLNMYNAGDIENIQIEKGTSSTQFEQPFKSEVNLPSGMSLEDGDTLSIDRDGTTQIIHAEGEPTVLDNVTLPELPAPTFNMYTTGGYTQPTVDVDYEQDVNIVIKNLKELISAQSALMQVNMLTD